MHNFSDTQACNLNQVICVAFLRCVTPQPMKSCRTHESTTFKFKAKQNKNHIKIREEKLEREQKSFWYRKILRSSHLLIIKI